VRRAIGWNPNDDEKKRKKVNARAAKIVKKAFAGKGCDVPAVAADLEVIAQSLKPLQVMRGGIEKEMRKMARKLPVWPKWGKGVRGFGELGLAVILAECGDLSNYANPAKVWKRLGLAPIEKGGVSMAGSNWRRQKGLSKEEWTAAGYSPWRRSEMFAFFDDSLFRGQSKPVGPYRQAYNNRRARTAETHADWTNGHRNGDARRVMTKKFLADLWAAWNGERAMRSLHTNVYVPSSTISGGTTVPQSSAHSTL
jgi:hypothetical protein